MQSTVPTGAGADRASDHSYRAIFESAAEAIYVLDPDTGAILDANPAACEMNGYGVEELKRRGIAGVSTGEPPYTWENALALIHRAAAGEPQQLEWLAIHSTGREVWGEVTLRRVTVLGEVRVLATARDVTERRAAQRELERANAELERRVEERTAALAEANRALESEIAEHRAARAEIEQHEEHFRRMIENASDMVQLIDATGLIRYTGPSVRHLLGYTPEEIAGTDPMAYVHPDDLDETAQALAQMLANPGELRVAHYRVRHKDGRYRRFEALARTLSPESAAEGVVVNARDVTERHETEKALRESEGRYRSLTENAHDIVTILDTEGRITYQSPQLERVLGYGPGEMIGQSALDFVHPDDVELPAVALGQILQTPGATISTEYRFRHKDGSWRLMETFGRTLLPDSASQGLIFNTRDVTERRQAEAALHQAKAEAEAEREAAERANRAKSEFLSRMSHELRTPMNSILGFAQLLDRAALPPEHRKGVGHILKAGRHLLKLINEVLEIARIETGRHSLSLEPVSLGAVLQEAVGLVRPLAGQWRVEVDEGPWTCGGAFVRADRQRLTQVLLNLLSNAIKYNRPGGTVRVGCQVEDEGGDRPRVAVRVADTGRGIPSDRLDELFVPFARLGAEQSEVEGTGLGLALSQRLAEAMGGSLALDETGPEGSVFRLELERAEDPVASLDEPAAGADPLDGAPHRDAVILYVEDNLANLSLVETILLSRPRWRTVPALQGQLGLELAREHAPDLILLDLHLPDIPGREVLRRLREDPRTAGIPVVVISADATFQSVQRLREAGAEAYLTKPLDIDEFMATLERFLGEAAP